MANQAKRNGWRLEHAPAASVAQGGKGGVTSLVRGPLALRKIWHHCAEWGQLVMCDVLGDQGPLTVISGYRRPGSQMDEANMALLEALTKSQRKNWVFAADWNVVAEEGPFSDFMLSFQAHLAGCSGHIRIVAPTDSVWVSQFLQVRRQ